MDKSMVYIPRIIIHKKEEIPVTWENPDAFRRHSIKLTSHKKTSGI